MSPARALPLTSMARRRPAAVTDSRSKPGQSPNPARRARSGRETSWTVAPDASSCACATRMADFLDPGVVAPPLLRVGRRENQGVSDDLRVSCGDEVRLHLHPAQAMVPVGGEPTLLVLDLGELGGCPCIARAGLATDVLAPRNQLGCPVVAAAGRPIEPLGYGLLDTCPVLVDQAGEGIVLDPVAGGVGQPPRRAGERHAARRDVGSAAQQEQVFQRTGLDGAVLVLAESDQSALDDLGTRLFRSGVAARAMVGPVGGAMSRRGRRRRLADHVTRARWKRYGAPACGSTKKAPRLASSSCLDSSVAQKRSNTGSPGCSQMTSARFAGRSTVNRPWARGGWSSMAASTGSRPRRRAWPSSKTPSGSPSTRRSISGAAPVTNRLT